MKLNRRTATIAAFFLLFFIGFNLIDSHKTLLSLSAFSIYAKKWGVAKLAIYWSVYALSIAALLAVVFSTSKKARWIGLATILLFGSIELTYHQINGYGTGFFEALTGIWEFSFAQQALAAFRTQVMLGIAGGVALTALLWLIATKTRLRIRARWLALVPLTFVMSYYIFWRTNAGTDQFPFVFKIPILAAYTLQSPLTGEREPVALAASNPEKAKNILFVVDESVRGDFLSLNGFDLQTTPFLDSLKNQIVNLGIASSGANCSQTSNIILQSGLRFDQLPDKSQRTLNAPNIFMYARAAGYKTFFLEGQYDPGKLPPHMSENDLQYIDEFFQVDKSDSARAGVFTDNTLAEKIKEILATENRAFILVNKRGAHFHYENAYPASERIFQPTLSSGVQVTQENKLDVLQAIPQKPMVNSYANAIRWSVDGFFRLLLPAIDLDEVAVLYTSDHGQNIKDNGAVATHCTTVDPPPTHAIVPMFLLGQPAQKYFAENVPQLQDRSSHFQIFSSLLIFMGYAEAEVVEKYHGPLWQPRNESRHFMSGDLFGRGSNFRINEFHFQPFSESFSTVQPPALPSENANHETKPSS